MDELDNPTNMRIIVSKLPYKIREKWRMLAFEIQEKKRRRVRFIDLATFVDRQAKIITDPLFGDLQNSVPEKKDKKASLPEKSRKEKIRGSSFATNVATVDNEDNVKSKAKMNMTSINIAFTRPCMFCKNNHSLINCHLITEKSHKEKLDFLRKAGLCFSCLVKGHLSKDCKRKMVCQICSEKHPDMLHFVWKQNVSKEIITDGKGDSHASEQTVISSALVSLNQEKNVGNGAGDSCVLAILPVCVKAKKGTKVVKTYAFVDPGSSATFCTESLARQLNIQGRGTELVLSTMSSTKQVKSCLIKDSEISGLEEDRFVDLPKVFTQKNIPVAKTNNAKGNCKMQRILKNGHICIM